MKKKDNNQNLVLCNQNFFTKTNNDDQFSNGTLITSTSSSTINNNTVNITNNINNYFYANYITPTKKYPVNQQINNIPQPPPSITPINPNPNSIVYSKTKVQKNICIKKAKDSKDYNKELSQVYPEQGNFNNKLSLEDKKYNNNDINQEKEKKYIKKKSEEKIAVLNVEELLMLEEKINSIISCLFDNNPCTEECFECFDFYFKTNFSQNISKFFLNEKFLITVKHSINLILFSLILCYDISLDENIFPQYNGFLIEIFHFVHKIFILISNYFYNKMENNSTNIWINKLKSLINQHNPLVKTTLQIFEQLNEINNCLICNKLLVILKKYSVKKIIDVYNQLDNLSQDELHRIYIDKIFRNMNINGSIIASSTFFKENQMDEIVSVPYIKTYPKKQFTLILDLDETLIHFKENPNNESSGLLRFRPFLTEFLVNVQKYYELIIFTAAVQDYADPIIDAIEKKSNVVFDFRLYRKHTNVVNNDFVKDLSKIGRDLFRVIIVDNMSQNYKLQPNNGICIRPFWGKDTKDMVLADLFNVLLDIAKNYTDVRVGIMSHKEDIISKITSNIFIRTQNY